MFCKLANYHSSVQVELQDIQRAMQMCMVTRYRKPENQLAALSALNIPHSAVLMHQGRSALLKPLFLIIRDDAREMLFVLIRGTTSIRDVFTSLTGAIYMCAWMLVRACISSNAQKCRLPNWSRPFQHLSCAGYRCTSAIMSQFRRALVVQSMTFRLQVM